MAATATQTKAPQFGDPVLDNNKPVQPIARERFVNASHVIGDMALITLQDDETIEEGAQDIKRFQHCNLVTGQWIEVDNDAETMWRLMRVSRIHGTQGSGLRTLVLHDVVPPKFFDKTIEPIVSTGEWYVRWGGKHRRWMVIQPNGRVRLEGIMSEAEARTICHRESGNPRPIGS